MSLGRLVLWSQTDSTAQARNGTLSLAIFSPRVPRNAIPVHDSAPYAHEDLICIVIDIEE